MATKSSQVLEESIDALIALIAKQIDLENQILKVQKDALKFQIKSQKMVQSLLEVNNKTLPTT